MQRQLSRLPLNKGEVALLAAETGGFTTVVAGRADGQVLLVRTLLTNWNSQRHEDENLERVSLDLKRTLSYVTQQFGLEINRQIWIFGPDAAQQAQVLQPLIGTPVAASPVEFQPSYWANESAKLRPDADPNFIGLKLGQSPGRDRKDQGLYRHWRNRPREHVADGSFGARFIGIPARNQERRLDPGSRRQIMMQCTGGLGLAPLRD